MGQGKWYRVPRGIKGELAHKGKFIGSAKSQPSTYIEASGTEVLVLRRLTGQEGGADTPVLVERLKLRPVV